MMTTKSSTIENLNSNKRKFISDDEVYPPSVGSLSRANQLELNDHTKRIKSITPERLPSSIAEVDVTDDMMICENSSSIISDTTNKSQVVLASKNCNSTRNVDINPQMLSMRCYCDPYRLNSFIPFDMDIY